MTAGDDHAHALLVSGRFPELEDALCERVQELRRGRPLAPLTVVVGSSNVRTRVGDLLVRRLGAIANVSVVTLGRLAADLVAAARGAPQPTLAGIARERLLRRLISARELAYFAPVQERPHFPQAVAGTFADLREARVAPASEWARVALGQGTVADTLSGAAKAADLQGLYGAYCDELARRGLADGAQVLLDAASAVRSVSESSPAQVVLYGIYDLNQAQEALVAELLGAGAEQLGDERLLRLVEVVDAVQDDPCGRWLARAPHGRRRVEQQLRAVREPAPRELVAVGAVQSLKIGRLRRTRRRVGHPTLAEGGPSPFRGWCDARLA